MAGKVYRKYCQPYSYMKNLPLRFPRIKLRTKFILFSVAFAIIPLLLVMMLVIDRLQLIQRENALDTNTELAQASAKEIESFIMSQYDILKQIDLVYGQSTFNAQTQDVLVERFLFLNNNFTDLTVLDATGKEKIRKNLAKFFTSADLHDRALSTEFAIIKQNRYYFSPLSSGQPAFTIGIPVTGPDGSFQGGVLAEVDARLMQNLIRKISVIEEQERAYIVNEKGTVIAHPDMSNVLTQKDFTMYPPVKSIVSPNVKVNPLDVYTNDASQQVLGATAAITIPYKALTTPAEQTKWFIVAEQPESLVLQQVVLITQFTLLILAAVLLLALTASILFARRIVRPIEKVHAAAQHIGARDLSQRIHIHTNDEVEDLANGFNAMAENLQNAFNTLEQDKNIISLEKNKLEVTLASIADAVIAVDGERKIIVFNAAAERMLHTSANYALGKPIDEILKVFQKDKMITPGMYCPVDTHTPNADAFDKSALKIVSHTGNTVFVNLVIGHIKKESPANLGCIVSLHDVTKEIELEDMKLDFVSMAAHELRTPLTSIKGYLFLMMNGMQFPPRETQYLTRIGISTDRLIGLVENILNVSKIERGVITMEINPTSWTDTVKEVISELSTRAREKNIQLQFREPEHPLPPVLADKFRITEVLINLVSNAISYTHPGGSIEVWVEQKDHEVITHIKDTGEGIPKEALPHLFTKFFRVSGKLEQGSKGTGLGLYIAKSIVEIHKGRIWVESELNKGAQFSFSLPTV